MPALKWSAEEVLSCLHTHFPQAFASGRTYEIESLAPASARVALDAGNADLRPGDTVSGPVQMELVDFSIYVLLLALHREQALMAVTTNFQINFLRKAGPGRITCDVELIKHGRRLCVADVRIIEAATERLIAHATATYFMAVED